MIIWLYTIVSVLVVSLISLIGVLSLVLGGKKLEGVLVLAFGFRLGNLTNFLIL